MNKNRLLTEEEFGKGIQECIDKVKNEMERDEIIEMMNIAGGVFGAYCFWEVEPDELERFANLVAAREREACAKICDRLGDETEDANAADCADAIRARGQG